MAEALTSAASAVTDAVKSTLYDRPREPEDWLSWEQVEQPVPEEDEKM